MSSNTGIYENVWIGVGEGMSSLRQTNMSSHTTHTTTNHHLSNHDDNNLDLLLEDLQTSVSRPGSSAGHQLQQSGPGPLTTGYREVSRSVTTHGVNGPSNSTEYQIEYLNPANTTTVVSERSVSPGFDILNNSAEYHPGTKKIAQYKVQSYQYKTVGGQNYQDGSGGSMKENINELDTLLDDLNTAQKSGFAAGNNMIAKKSTGLNSSFIEPLQTSTPKGGHVSRSVEKKVVQEHRYGSVGRQSPAREIKHEKVIHESSPLHQRKETYRYETKTTKSGNLREASPPSPPAIRSSPSPSRHQQQVRSYNYSSATEHDAPRTPSAFRRANSPSHRSPSPAGKPTVKSYNYSSSSTSNSKYSSDVQGQGHQQPPYRSPSPTSRTTSTARAHTYDQSSYRAPASPPPQPKHTTVHSYNYSSTSTSKDTRQEVPKTPPPHRSPSPVSFPQPPLPSPKNTDGKPYTFPIQPQSPLPAQKFSPSDPSRTLNYQVSPHQPTVITYKYSSHSTQSTNYPGEGHVPLQPRPFPTSPSPTPEEQRPPKKLDELMASFSDSETHQHSSLRHRDVTSNRYTHQPPQQAQPKPPAPPTPPPEPKVTRVNHHNNSVEKSKNMSGPPVYYPPGVELFSKKEELMQQSEGGGMMKSKAKASYEYESKSKSKAKESSGKAVVPVCLPVCCAMPCVIM